VFSDDREELDRHLVRVRVVAANEVLGFLQLGDEGDVAREAIQLGDNEARRSGARSWIIMSPSLCGYFA
jgi:hypothetical protein